MTDDPAARRRDYLVVDSPHQVARWRPLINVVLSIPHLLIASALGRLANVVFFVYWLAFVFTGKLNGGLYSLMTMSERYNTRASGLPGRLVRDLPALRLHLQAPATTVRTYRSRSTFRSNPNRLPVPPRSTSSRRSRTTS